MRWCASAIYKNHRVVDDRFGVITAIETTAEDIAENTKLLALVQPPWRESRIPCVWHQCKDLSKL